MTHLVQWIDGDVTRYHSLALGITAVMLAAVFGRILATDRPSARARRWAMGAGVVLPLLMLATLLAWRWPAFVLPHELNADESQQLAGAITLTAEPVFWRAVDGANAGPLNFYVFLPLHWLGLPISFATGRLLAALLAWGSVLACRVALRHWTSESTSWLAVMPALAFYAAALEWDFVHYSSEHVSVFLFSLALAGVAGLRTPADAHSPQTTRTLLTGLAAGALPWAKLQSGPLLLVIAALLLLANGPQWRTPAWQRRAAVFFAGAALPTLACALMLLVIGELGMAWTSYFVSSFHYISASESLPQVLTSLWREISRLNLYVAMIGLTALWTFIGGIAAMRARRVDVRLVTVALLVLATTAFVALAPRRGFPHYLLFLTPGWMVLAGAAVHHWTHESTGRLRTRGGIAAGAVLSVLVGFHHRLDVVHPGLQVQPQTFAVGATTPLGQHLQSVSATGDRLVVWGWQPHLHVESGLPQGTRDAHSQRQIERSPLQKYYRDRYLADLERVRPRWFVDAVRPGAFAFTDSFRHGHEAWRELQRFVRQHYRLVAEIDGAHLYERREP